MAMEMPKITHTSDLKITSNNRSEKLVTASHAISRILVKIVSKRLIFTKSNEELSPILTGLSYIRKYMGTSELKTYETDNFAVDGNLWKKNFPELENDVVVPVVIDENLGNATMSNDDFTYFTRITALNNWDKSVVADVDKNIAICAGIDYR